MMLGHSSHWVVIEQGAGLITEAMLACLTAQTIMTYFSHRLRLPIAALAFDSVVSMMPGIFLFRLADGFIVRVQGHLRGVRLKTWTGLRRESETL